MFCCYKKWILQIQQKRNHIMYKISWYEQKKETTLMFWLLLYDINNRILQIYCILLTFIRVFHWLHLNIYYILLSYMINSILNSLNLNLICLPRLYHLLLTFILYTISLFFGYSSLVVTIVFCYMFCLLYFVVCFVFAGYVFCCFVFFF